MPEHASREGRRPEAPAVGVVIPVYRDLERLRICLDLLAQQVSEAPSVLVAVVDNEPSSAVERACASYPFVAYLREPKPGSYAARNAGVRFLIEQGCDVIGFTDSDCVPSADWIANAVRGLGATGADALAGPIGVFARDPDRPTAAEQYDMVVAFPVERYVRRLGFGPTANLWTTRATLEVTGGFDGSVKSGGDVDWGRRLEAHGRRIVFDPSVVVAHPARGTFDELARKGRRVLGGHFQRARSRGAAPLGRLILRTLFPPVKRAYRIARHPDATMRVRLVALRVELGLYLVRLVELARLVAGGAPAR